MAGETFSAPLAIIKVGSAVIGKAKSLRVSESYNRGSVVGIGRINASEAPLLSFTGNLTMGFYTIDFTKHPLGIDAILREAPGYNVDQFQNTHVLQQVGLTIDLLRQVPDIANFPPLGKDANNVMRTTNEVFARITDLFITADNFDLNEGQLSGRDSTFTFLTPVIRVT